MSGGQGDTGQPTTRGGKAAERLREFLAARFGDKAPRIPPDELPLDDEPDDAASTGPTDEACAPPPPPQSP